jgi:hypothetical protein
LLAEDYSHRLMADGGAALVSSESGHRSVVAAFVVLNIQLDIGLEEVPA